MMILHGSALGTLDPNLEIRKRALSAKPSHARRTGESDQALP
ncbi:hypothetical protein PO124_26350 [Bacillus licheniformis]|nr:hypothetical protein [Bacillus licheniformis]